MMPILIIGVGLAIVAALTLLALSGPSASKATARRLESLKDRHSTSTASMAQAQMRRILATRETRLEIRRNHDRGADFAAAHERSDLLGRRDDASEVEHLR